MCQLKAAECESVYRGKRLYNHGFLKYLNSTQCSTSLLLKTCKKWQAAKSSEPGFKSKIEVHLIARQETQTSVRIIHQNIQPEPTNHRRGCASWAGASDR